ncbi:GTP pyrophosphokinase [Desulfonatronum thiosulfatophilum]|uniref:GTP pyrophosphokinase n=1 Tax=Desulfonatronum thiosulfatophilum TaxID=617002 RepID=A0A1G6EHS2_9BACT|nr:bifunctional (p)ppGpp synthetase/guanosine-3',5'-bis(diphosphate) 3'-pyrophosphohydrolase [Desulfonatronum thiosulfatophilum]SDB56904.1 GTP pyrophosphokinase [Desulfonatronum thiosulfatophilum]
MIRIHEILDKVSGYMSEEDMNVIQKAYVFSAAAHAGQTRLSGEPYLFHPLEVANSLAEMKLDRASIAAGLLHDTVEDTKVTVKEIATEFGDDVAKIVAGTTKISKMSFHSKEEAQAENIRKMILAMADDIRVLMVKLADRLHNMRTLEFQKNIKQRLIAKETLDIYAPLANRLGLYRVKVQLEDLSLRYLKPDIYQQIANGVQQHQSVGQEYISKVHSMIEELLRTNKISGRVKGRIKHIYSIYHKMLQQGLNLDQVYDLIAFRTIVGSIKDCYAVLGLVHSLWKPVPGRFKDYISMPKKNMYQSLHTTVFGPDGERIEIQIRTEDMNRLAEYGVAAHWQYKEGSKSKDRDADRFSWLRQILDWQQDLDNPREFMASLRIDLFQDEVYVFTPRGDVKELPEGATPVDFAYLVHTEVGNHCNGARVNGRLVPLSTPLHNGDTVEIITDLGRHPSKDWLKFVKTAKAKARIKHWVRTEERDRSIAFAREILEKEGRKVGVNMAKALKDGRFDKVVEELSFKTREDLLTAVGYARLTPRQVLHRMLPAEQQTPEVRSEATVPAHEPSKSIKSRGISIKGVDDVLVQFAKCCNPLPGDPIVGFISRGRGAIVHTVDCPNVAYLEPERMLDVFWEGEPAKSFPAKIRIICRNAPGVLGEISMLMAKEAMNIDSGSFSSRPDGKTEMLFYVEVRDSAHLYGVIEKISKLDSVVEVIRLTEQ